MPKPNQTAERWRLGPCAPPYDPWGLGAWDSKCDLYDVESREKCPSGIGDIAPPATTAIAPVVPPLENQLLFTLFTPPVDRLAIYVTFMKQVGGSPARPAPTVSQLNATPSPWVITVQRGIDCVDEPIPFGAGVVNYKPTTFMDFGLILEVRGSPLSTYWAFYAYQLVSAGGPDIAWQAAFRVIACRQCCEDETVVPGGNTTPID